MLAVNDLRVRIAGDDKEVLRGVSLDVKEGEVVAIMGPNGSGKSTLAYALMGHPKYEVVSGSALFDGDDLLSLAPDARARKGLFLSFQYPQSVAGVTLQEFLRAAYNSVHTPLSVPKFRRLLREKMALLQMKPEFATRYVNDGWSGGEKKRGEVLQLTILNPRLALLDETDSGLDIDAIKIVSEGINQARKANPQLAVVVITHYRRILDYIRPDRVLVLVDGVVKEVGGPELVDRLETHGYQD